MDNTVGERRRSDGQEDSVATSRPADLFSKKIAACLNLRKEIIKSSVWFVCCNSVKWVTA